MFEKITASYHKYHQKLDAARTKYARHLDLLAAMRKAIRIFRTPK
jgi:hypothetical protein